MAVLNTNIEQMVQNSSFENKKVIYFDIICYFYQQIKPKNKKNYFFFILILFKNA